MNDCGKKDYEYLSHLMHDPTMHTNSLIVRTMVNTAVQHPVKGRKVLPWFLPGNLVPQWLFLQEPTGGLHFIWYVSLNLHYAADLSKLNRLFIFFLSSTKWSMECKIIVQELSQWGCWWDSTTHFSWLFKLIMVIRVTGLTVYA